MSCQAMFAACVGGFCAFFLHDSVPERMRCEGRKKGLEVDLPYLAHVPKKKRKKVQFRNIVKQRVCYLYSRPAEKERAKFTTNSDGVFELPLGIRGYSRSQAQSLESELTLASRIG